MNTDNQHQQILALSGGVGGAKLALGLAGVLAADQLTVACNTGDDFEHLGLYICPDLDTVTYTLAGRSHPQQGWGLADESWQVMAALGELGADRWFQLGDRDIATHLLRNQWRQQGLSLTDITAKLCAAMGVAQRILPMSDDRVATLVDTDQGSLSFQQYFVREQCRPAVRGFRFAGIEQAAANPQLMQLLQSPGLQAVLICPSNPYVSIDPILSLPGLRQQLQSCAAPVIAVSPIVGGAALKGPAAKMMAELGQDCSALGVAHYYRDCLDGFIFDEVDTQLTAALAELGIPAMATQTVMKTLEDKQQLARVALDFAARLRASSAVGGPA